ncbi:hypothetical protein BGM19_06020 [Streptomyces agglomeratus]|uniref:DUF4232 domain-containing protein n=1 Tax=Streptomyces agglomeratus TaxID=285458 RepID=UPI0008546073|nr:DUF4232 domain-containing protein [Streptomyces agglomeratus]OEJ50258.1 hypothetical protein BGK72_05335 [Streptomyces agglomeratus]OEJ57585.1 hypothetical protein BGM19_06020 [Streptomyces agglomeratus]
MRTSRIHATAPAAAVAALALALTACGGSDSAGAGGYGARADVTGGGAAAGSPEPVGAGGADSDAGPVPAGSTGARQCDGGEVSYSVLHRFPGQQGEHLLITARNAGAEPCWVVNRPSVMLGDTSTVLPHAAKDAPGGGARLTIRPGGRVYSAVNLFADAKTRMSAALSLALRDGGGDTGPGTELEAFDGKGAPSEFTWSGADVMNWNTVKPYNF